MREQVLLPTKSDPPRRGASPMDSAGDGVGFFRLLGSWLGKLPWLQLGLACVILMAAAATPWMTSAALSALDREIETVRLSSELNRLDRADIQDELDSLVGRSFFATELSSVKRALEAEPWVASAAIRRIWPDLLEVDIREKRPLAYWNERQLISRQGEVFHPRNPEVAGPLPRLSGPTARVDEVMTKARVISGRLEEHGLRLAGLSLASRGAWTLKLDNGVAVALGRSSLDSRLERFLTVYDERLASRIQEIRRVDARYTNGVAVQWKEAQPDGEKNS